MGSIFCSAAVSALNTVLIVSDRHDTIFDYAVLKDKIAASPVTRFVLFVLIVWWLVLAVRSLVRFIVED